jgi:hypothetical protein
MEVQEVHKHGRMNCKDTKPYMSLFFKIDLLTDFAALCLADFIDLIDFIPREAQHCPEFRI